MVWEEMGEREMGVREMGERLREVCGSEGAFKQQVCGGTTGSKWSNWADICS